MRAAVVERYGPPDVVGVRSIDAPTPRRGEVLVRVHASAVTAADSRIRGARFPAGFGPFARLAFGIRRPRRPVLGGCCSGVVEAVGDDVDLLRVGDRVTGMTGMRMGAHAELVAVKAARLARTPGGVDHDDAAAVLFGGTTALHYLRDRIHLDRPRERPATVLVNGASGAVGTIAVQLARRWGADVTGVTSGPNRQLVESLGAHRTIDHTTTALADLTDRYDVVIDAVGNVSIRDGRRLLRPDGVLGLVVADLGATLRATATRGRVVAGSSPESADDVALLLDLVDSGDLRVVVDATFDLDGIVDAHRRVDSGHKVGNVVLRP